MKELYEFGRFTLDVQESRLLRDGQPVTLKPKVLETLLVLVENTGRVMDKEGLMQRLWPDSFVEEANLAVNISQLRKALGDDENGEQYIETVPKRGYRFTARVTKMLAEPVDLVMREHTKARIVVEEQETSDDDGGIAQGAERFGIASGSRRALPAPITASKRHKALTIAAVACLGVAVVAGFALYRLAQQRRSGGFPQMVISRLTWTGNVQAAAVSPDGKSVAYATLDSGLASVWILNVPSGSSARVIEPRNASYEGLAFSPDGNFIYFNQSVNDRSAIYVMPVFGGAAKELAKGSVGHVAISPDGRQLAFVRHSETRDGTELMTVNVDGSGERKVATRKAPDFFFTYPDGLVWSPDSKMIACRGGSSGADGLYRNVIGVRVDDGKETQISSHRWKWIGGIAWPPEGDGLLITASDQQQGNQTQQIWRLSYPGGEAQKITNDLSGYSGLSLAANSTILLTLERTVSSNIWIASTDDASRARPLTHGTYDGGRGLTWTPDGHIVYSSRSSGTDQIWIMDADGSNQKQLTVGPARSEAPTVTEDGRYIVFDCFDTDTLRINVWRMDIDGSNRKQLSSGNNDVWPQGSSDSKWVLYTRHDSPTGYTIWKVPIDGGESIALTETAAANCTVSPDGKLVACAAWDHNSSKVAIVPFAGGAPIKLVDVPGDIHYASLHWTTDGSAISYSTDGGSKVWAQPLTGGPLRELANSESDRLWYAAWSRDGKHFAVARGRTTSDVVLISNFR